MENLLVAKGAAQKTESAAAPFRSEIASLRGIAILGVLFFHTKLFGAKGGFLGVDLFYVISGFLITQLLVKEYQAKRTINLAAFYARRARRLLPAALMVLITTAILVSLFAPENLKKSVLFDLVSALLFFSNFNFAASSTNYFASATPSPVLHFWSLSVEEQFYLIIPVTFYLLTKRYRKWRSKLFRTFLLITALSLCLSFIWRHSLENWDFFSLPTRAWELAFGALLATTNQLTRKFTRTSSEILAFLATATILFLIFNPWANQIYPDWSNLTIVLAGAVILDLGRSDQYALRALRLLGNKFLNFIGEISYSLYLWHWPVWIIFSYRFPQTHGFAVSLLIVLISFALAIFSTKLIENPIRAGKLVGKSSGKNLTTALVALALTFWALFSYQVELKGQAKRALHNSNLALQAAVAAEKKAIDTATTLQSDRNEATATVNLNTSNTSAKSANESATSSQRAPSETEPTNSPAPKAISANAPALAANYQSNVAADQLIPQINGVDDLSSLPTTPGAKLPKITYPPLAAVDLDRAASYNDRCHTEENLPPSTAPCIYGDTSSKKTIVLFGDSHALSWFPTLNLVATEHHWKLLSLTMSACPPANVPAWEPSIDGRSTNCDLWRSSSISRIIAAKPFAILISATRGFELIKPDGELYVGQDRIDTYVAGMNQTLTQLKKTGAKLIYIHDIPVDNEDPNNCLAANQANPNNCALSPENAFDQNWFAVENGFISNFAMGEIDPTYWICPTGPCPLVEGNYLVYLDAGHLTASFATALAPVFNQSLLKALNN